MRHKNRITLPYDYTPRHYQRECWEAFDRGIRRQVRVWHRRAGKDLDALHLLAREMFVRKGTYYFMAPYYAQGRKIAWEGMDATGKRFVDAIHPELRSSLSSQDMRIETINGSMFRVVGSDNMDSVVGTNPVGIIFSEYSLHDPNAWDLMRPVLRENGGWAIFTYTPRGRNHGYNLYKMAQNNPAWFASKRTWKDTGVLTESDIQEERDAGFDDEMIDQEYMCSFAVGAKGSYYAKEIEEARKQGRIGDYQYRPGAPVFVFFDLGKGDATSMWFVQFNNGWIDALKYHEGHSDVIDDYMEVALDTGWNISEFWLPHDGDHHRLEGRGVSLKEQAEDYLHNMKKPRPVEVTERAPLEASIRKTRALIKRMRFNQEGCERGIDCLYNYMRKWDAERKTFVQKPEHNWASHGADALRTMAISGVADTEGDRPPQMGSQADEDGWVYNMDKGIYVPERAGSGDTISDFNIFNMR